LKILKLELLQNHDDLINILENLVEYKGIKELNIHFYYNYDIIETLNNKVFKN
jgi:hypothetical protein